MDEKRKKWCKKYKVKIADGGFIDKFCMPEHVQCILPARPGQKPYFIGFDGKSKTYEQLTEEEKQDYREQQVQIPENLHEFTNKKCALEKAKIDIVKKNRDKSHKNVLEKSNINLIKDIDERYRERTRRIKNICSSSRKKSKYRKEDKIMGMKHFNPYTPSRRNMTVSDFSEITKKTPEKSLLAKKKEKAGRNSYGRITVRHQGGGNRQKYRIIDFKRRKDNMEATVIGIEYDPNRSANIALIQYEDGEKAYILAPQGLTDGDKVISGESVDIKAGNAMPIDSIPVGTLIHNIELNPGQGGKLVRTAGQSAQLMAKEGKYATLRLPSGEMRKVLAKCRATVGVIGNADHENVKIGKAGRKRHMGWRPTVRGSVMNPVDHPHGGGEGRAPVGHAGPMTPWGKPALGYKTRNKKKQSNKLIVKRRK